MFQIPLSFLGMLHIKIIYMLLMVQWFIKQTHHQVIDSIVLLLLSLASPFLNLLYSGQHILDILATMWWGFPFCSTEKNYSLFHKTLASTGLQHLRLNWLATCPDKNSLPKSHLEVTPPSLSQVDSQQNSNRFQSKRALLSSAVTLELDEGRFDQQEVNISLDKLQSFTSPNLQATLGCIPTHGPLVIT